MTNRGLLTRPSISPLGAHRDRALTDLQSQRVAVVTAEFTHKDAVAPDHRRPQPNTFIEDSHLPLRPAASPVPSVTAKRYTLIHKLDAGLRQHLEALLAHFSPLARSAAKRATRLAFRSHLASVHLDGAPASAPIDSASYRIDIRLTDPMVQMLLVAAGQTAFEPKATALARSVTPYFVDFVRKASAENSETVSKTP